MRASSLIRLAFSHATSCLSHSLLGVSPYSDGCHYDCDDLESFVFHFWTGLLRGWSHITIRQGIALVLRLAAFSAKVMMHDNGTWSTVMTLR